MLNIFPDLLYLQQFAPLVVRVVIGFELAGFAYQTIIRNHAEKAVFFEGFRWAKNSFAVWLIGILEFIVGGFLVLGFLTQVAALAALAICLAGAFGEIKRKGEPTDRSSHLFVLAVISITLLFTGAGFYALDLPL